jgi:hypothetical protein
MSNDPTGIGEAVMERLNFIKKSRELPAFN